MAFLTGYNEEGSPIYTENAPQLGSTEYETGSNPYIDASLAQQRAANTADQRQVNGQTYIAVQPGHPLYGQGQMINGEMLVPFDIARQWGQSQNSGSLSPFSRLNEGPLGYATGGIIGAQAEKGFNAGQGPAIVGGVLGGLAAAGGGTLGAAGSEVAGSTAGAAPLAGADLAAPAGTVLGTGAQEAAIADLVATGMSQEAATAAVMGQGAAPWVPGAAQIGGPGTGMMSGAGGSTALSRLLGLGQTGSDLLSVGGALAPGILGYLGAGKQADAYRDVQNQYLNIGAPYRGTLSESYQPGFNLMSQPGYGDALNRSAEIATRAASAKYGNPGENPGAIADITNQVYAQTYLPALATYRGQLGQFGGLGLNTAGAAGLGGAGVAGGGLDAIGVGLGRAMTPQLTLADLYKNYGLTVGGARS